MTNFFVRQAVANKNDLNRSLGALLGIAQGVLCDRELNDEEIHFLDEWLRQNESIAFTWPGEIIYARIRSVLEDGVITETERMHLTETLQKLIGGSLEKLSEPNHVTELAFDDNTDVVFEGKVFCLTGEFVFAPRDICVGVIANRGGAVSAAVNRKVSYLVVGGLGSAEWKHGSFGSKIEQAVAMRNNGLPIKIVHEDHWANALSKYPC